MSEHNSSSGTYRIELLGSNNWMPWKRRMLAILRDLGLEEYIEKDAKSPVAAKPSEPTKITKQMVSRLAINTYGTALHVAYPSLVFSASSHYGYCQTV